MVQFGWYRAISLLKITDNKEYVTFTTEIIEKIRYLKSESKKQ